MKNRTRALLLALLASLLAFPGTAASAEDPPAAVTLTADKAVYVASQTARLTSRITATNLHWVVSVQFPGSSEWKQLCLRLNVNTSVADCKLGVYYNAKVRALLIDGNGTDDTSDDTIEAMATRNLAVKPQIGTSPLGYYTKSGGYAVFPKGYSPKYRAATYPGFEGKRCLRHEVQRYYASGWRTVFTSACRVQGKQGRVDWVWAGKHPSGVKFRLRAKFAGDAVNVAANSTWNYLRFR